MKKTLFVALLAGLLPAAAQAQHVTADLRVVSGPVAAHVIVGRPYYRPVVVRREVIVVHRYYAPRVIVVRRIVHPHRGWYRAARWNRVVAYYDHRNGRYFDRYDARTPGLREVRLYERGGQYYDLD
jgi:hypothetical protein